jgi:hypothetical protein
MKSEYKNGVVFALVFLAFSLQAVAATTVELTADKEVVWIGQRIGFTLKLSSEDRITGQLTVINLDEKRQEKILFQSVAPACCGPDRRVRGEYTDKSSFTPEKLGNYQARAYFDQVERTLNFTVKSRLAEETTTTTTIPEIIPDMEGYIILNWYNLDKCRSTVLGGMNTLNFDIGEEVPGIWGLSPASYVLFSCDGGEKHPVDRLLLKGGANMGVNQTIAGSYRLMVRCGRNTLVEDLTKCKNLGIFLDTKGAIMPQEHDETTTTTQTTITTTLPAETTTTTEPITSTTLSERQKDTNLPGDAGVQPALDGCLCESAPLLIIGIFIFVILVGAVYKYLEDGKKETKNRLGGEK